MSASVTSTVGVAHQAVGLQVTSSKQRDTYESGAGYYAGLLASGESEVTYDGVITPRTVLVKNLSGGTLRIGTATGVYTQRLGVGDGCSFQLEVDTLRNITEVVCVADVADSLDGKYMDLTQHGDAVLRVWIKTSGGAASAPSTPTPPGSSLLQVDIWTDDTADSVATAIEGTLGTHGYFIAARTNDTLLITDRHTGVRTPVAETAGSFVVGGTYVIVTTGSTDFTLIGAADSLPGTVFTATGAGAGTGTAYLTNNAGFATTVTQAGAASPKVFLLPVGDVEAVMITLPN